MTSYRLRDKKNNEYCTKIPGTIGGHKKLKIYGEFDCPNALKWIAKEYYVDQRVFFSDEGTAIEAGYRPCAVFMKKEYRAWKQSGKKSREN